MEIKILPNVLQRLTSLDLTCNWIKYYVLKLLQHCSALEGFKAELDFATDRYTDNSSIVGLLPSSIVLPKLQTIALGRVRASALRNLRYLEVSSFVQVSISMARDTSWRNDVGCRRHALNNAVERTVWIPLASFLRGSIESETTMLTLTIMNANFLEDRLFEALIL